MRQSEREARIQGVANKLFGQARQVLSVGVGSAVGEPDPAWARARRYDAALWRLSADISRVRTGLSILRGALSPGAALLLVAPHKAPLLQQLQGVLTRVPAPHARLAPLCDALLLAGFGEPRVYDVLPGWWVVSAVLAPHEDRLDVFFEQPSLVSSR